MKSGLWAEPEVVNPRCNTMSTPQQTFSGLLKIIIIIQTVCHTVHYFILQINITHKICTGNQVYIIQIIMVKHIHTVHVK